MKSPLLLVVASLSAITALAGCTAVFGDFSTGDIGLDGSVDSGEPGPDVTQDTSQNDGGGVDRTSPEGGGSEAGRDAEPDADGGRPADGGTESGGSGCDAGQLVCNDTCVADDIPNCGTCGNNCGNLPHVSGATTCVSGHCSFKSTSCAPGFADCDGDPTNGCEADLTQSSHCGSCTTTCSGGTPLCVPTGGDAGTYSCGTGCPSGTPTLCGTSCVNTSSDPQNCMTCGNACPAVMNGQPACTSGTCDVTCNTNYHKCGGTCWDNTSTSSCGTSCNPCPTAPANGVEVCTAMGSCAFTCNANFHQCGSICADNSSVNSCGTTSCNACAAPANGTATCNGVSCSFTCSGSLTACTAQNLCVDETSDSSHCGSCTKACNGVACTGGRCVERDGATTAFSNPTNMVGGSLFGIVVTVPNAITVTALASIVSTANTSNNYIMGLYTNAGNTPGTLLVQTAVSLMSPAGADELPVTPTPIAAGTYFIVAQTGTGSGYAWYYDPTIPYYYTPNTYAGSMPATAPPNMYTPSTAIPGTGINYYVVGYQ